MGRLAEFLLHQISDEQSVENNTSMIPNVVTSSSTAESSFFNIMENLERTGITDNPSSVCAIHMPSWLNVWCIIVTISILAVLIVLGVIMRHIQLQKHRQVRTECYNCFPSSPEYYSEHLFDRSQIMVY
ncbi:uncharacterized protein LOC142224174 [Haematobia irritans]|uniref:uncharacterized protein LOC142224174 n=1 Tax=Haematobia irritans TaxID=7368 RepID=UPI003F502D5D